MPNQVRQNWGKTHTILPKLDLVGLQLASYEAFLNVGIKATLDEVYQDGIEDYTGKNWRLSFGEYRFGQAKYTIAQAKS